MNDLSELSDGYLTNMLHKLRAQNFELSRSEKRLLGAIACAYQLILHDPRLDVEDPQDKTKKVKDQRYITVMEILDKAVEASVKVPA